MHYDTSKVSYADAAKAGLTFGGFVAGVVAVSMITSAVVIRILR